eukprot:Selendium_serpulae@DN6455_c1_g1_i5.p1
MMGLGLEINDLIADHYRRYRNMLLFSLISGNDQIYYQTSCTAADETWPGLGDEPAGTYYRIYFWDTGRLSETSWEAARVIEVLSLNEKLYKEVDRILDASEDVGGEDDVRKIVKHLLVWRQTIETIIKRNKHSKKYTVGEKLSLADLSLFAVYKWICSGSIGAIPGEHLDKAPHLLNVLDSVIAHPKISEREAKLEPIPSFLEGEYEAAAG